MTTEKLAVCRHGALRRSCETCDLAEDCERLERDLAAAREQIAALTAERDAARERVAKLEALVRRSRPLRTEEVDSWWEQRHNLLAPASKDTKAMTPTREQVHEWAEETQLSHYHCYVVPGFSGRLQRVAALAFAAGQSGQASGAGAELVRDVEASRDEHGVHWRAHAVLQRWDRLRAALLSGDAAREDAGRLEVELAWQRFCLKNVRMLAARHRKEEWAQHMLRFCDEAGVKASPLRDAAIDAAMKGGQDDA